jgi:serine/threonine protein kinase
MRICRLALIILIMIGEKIFNYEVTAHLGQGGMGNVYRATDNMLGREVALKMLHPQLTSQPLFLERFKKEARVLAQLLHPNIAVIYNFIEQGGNHFMVMEYVEGTTLDNMLKRYGALPTKVVVPIFIQALEGLQHAHRKNIFHRDIKPSNLMVTPDGTLKLMDFGIAKVAGEQKMTQVNKIVGTVEFMAPELIEGKQASIASDIYAMGATLYELISGKLPFEGDTDFNLMQAILKHKVRPPDKWNALVPKALVGIVMKALEKNPENRFPDARSFQQALMQAFPAYREIDVSLLKPPEPTTIISHSASDGAMTKVEQNLNTISSVPMETKVQEQARPFSIKEFLEENVTNTKRLPYILAGIGLLFFLMMIGSTLFSKKEKNIIPSESGTLNQRDTSKKESALNDQHGGGPVTVISPTPNTPLPTLKDEPTVVKKETPVKVKKKKQESNGEDKPVVKTVPTEPTPKQEERKEVYLDSKLDVSLYLRENLENNDKERDRPITFSVTHPVTYNGVTIIRQGAIAKGTISIGHVLTSIEIDEVTGANGQTLYFQSARFHRKRSELSTDRDFEATLKSGVQMKF